MQSHRKRGHDFVVREMCVGMELVALCSVHGGCDGV